MVDGGLIEVDLIGGAPVKARMRSAAPPSPSSCESSEAMSPHCLWLTIVWINLSRQIFI
jgi:hypothetical protein